MDQHTVEIFKFLLELAKVLVLPIVMAVMRKLDEISKVAPPPPAPVITVQDVEDEVRKTQLEEMEAQQAKGYRENLQMAKNLAKEDPRVVANVVKAWVGANE